MPSNKIPREVLVLSTKATTPGGGAAGGAGAAIATHLSTTVGAHPASAIAYNGGVGWASGGSHAAASVEATLDAIFTELAENSSEPSGAAQIGSSSVSVGIVNLAAGSVRSQLLSMVQAANLNYAAGPTWADLDTNPQTTVQGQLDKIVTDLSSVAGAGKVGAIASGNLSAGTVRSQLDEIQTNWARYGGTGTFTGGNTFSGNNMFSGNNTFSAANTFSAIQHFNAGLDAAPSVGYKYSSNSLTRMARRGACNTNPVLANSATVTTSTGFVVAALTGGSDSVTFYSEFQVPVGAQVQTLYALVQSHSGTTSNSVTLTFHEVRYDGSGATTSSTSAHTNGSPAWKSVSPNLLDERLRTDPSGSSDVTWYNVSLRFQYDVGAGGTQNHQFYGFVLKYYIPSGGAAQLEEST